MSAHRVLLVDDDPMLLNAFRRQLRGIYELETATSPGIGLDLLKKTDAFQVVVSDMQMPMMNGLEFLRECRKVSPNTIRVMLTGNADQATVINAINDGEVFRFLLKPCESATLIKTLADSIREFQALAAERDAATDAQCSALKLITDIVNSVRPETYQHSMEARKLASEIAREMQLSNFREVELGAMLSYFGSISVPQPLFQRYLDNQSLTARELAEVERFVEFSRRMIDSFVGFDNAERLIACQLHAPNVTTPVGARVIRVTNDFLRISRTKERLEAVSQLRSQTATYDADVIKALENVLSKRFKEVEVAVSELKPGFILLQALRSNDGLTLIESSRRLTVRMLDSLEGVIASGRLSPSTKVRVVPEAYPTSMLSSSNVDSSGRAA